MEEINHAEARVTVKPGLKLLVSCLTVISMATAAAGKSRPAGNKAPVTDAETVLIPAGGTFQKLVIVEARQQLQAGKARRIISFIPAGRLSAPVSVVIAQKGLSDSGQINTGSSAFLTRLADFSAPRLAVYDDRNPCVKDQDKNVEENDGKKDPQVRQPTMSVAGVPYIFEDPAAKAETVVFSGSELKKHARGLSYSDQALLTSLAGKGYGLVRVTFKPGKQKEYLLSAAVQIAAETTETVPKTEIHGSKEFLVERFFLGPETTESLPGIPMTEFPTGIELPHETSSVWAQAYNEWVAPVIRNAGGVRRFAGPVNRCDICYEQPPQADTLQAAGAFWTTDAPAVNQGNLRTRASVPAATFDTWLTRHLIKKPAKAPLLLVSEALPASVSGRFVEQGSVQRPFHGEIFCPAMEGYQKSLGERREKTIAALNGLNGWTEKDLKDAFSHVGGTKPAWYQDHFKNGK